MLVHAGIRAVDSSQFGLSQRDHDKGRQGFLLVVAAEPTLTEQTKQERRGSIRSALIAGIFATQRQALTMMVGLYTGLSSLKELRDLSYLFFSR